MNYILRNISSGGMYTDQTAGKLVIDVEETLIIGLLFL